MGKIAFILGLVSLAALGYIVYGRHELAANYRFSATVFTLAVAAAFYLAGVATRKKD